MPGLRATLNSERAVELGTRIAAGKKTAPTRPHPHMPPSPGALKTAGPIAAAADKAPLTPGRWHWPAAGTIARSVKD